MLRDWGCDTNCTLYADTSAARAIAKLKGAGSMRHISESALWNQDVQDREGAEYHEVLGTENPADLMIKYLTREKNNKHISIVGQVFKSGRAATGLEMHMAGTA